MKIEAYFDGACGPINPGGKAGWGFAVLVDGVLIAERYGCCGSGPEMSNNVAEYAGLSEAMKFVVAQFAGQPATFIGDSQLVIEQMRGKWRIKSGLYASHGREAVRFAKGRKFSFKWVPRGENAIADALSKKGAA